MERRYLRCPETGEHAEHDLEQPGLDVTCPGVPPLPGASTGGREREKVVISYLNPGTVTAEFHESVLGLLVYDMGLHRRIVDGGGHIGVRSSANLAGPRNGAVKLYLNGTAAEWFLFLDTDMVFRPDLVEQLLEHASEEKAPIVGGLCFGIDEGRLFPTLYEFAEQDGKLTVVRYEEWAPAAMMQVAATGCACLLVHRSVFTRIAAQDPSRPGFSGAFPWFQEREFDGRAVGEDVTFCWRAGLLGIPVHVNTAVHLGHVKDTMLTIDKYMTQREADLAAREPVTADA